ncbi:tRNA uridine(34) 5-carboxymethylaminomethyl modification radical SAM/GNAT enzyme Elp3 [bacterium]|nr:tRNA uridine(34) 5-carboxymethylaminomethyl modification radical SAM/GNAT enzyme Elp3 [bacterium]
MKVKAEPGALEKIFLDVIATARNIEEFQKLLREKISEQRIPYPSKVELLAIYRNVVNKGLFERKPFLESFLLKKEMRTLSGVAPVAVFTKPFPCPGHCIYCPSEKGVPKSYIHNEPAVMRAEDNQYDPFRQVEARLRHYREMGHPTSKVDLIVMGGTFSYLPRSYQTWFIKRCFDALNGRTARSLAEAQSWNETAQNRCVGLTVETRPDLINEEELKRFRKLGVTRVEIGVQSLYDDVLLLNKRGHTTKEVKESTKLLKDAGFKVTYHMMLNLLGSDKNKDYEQFEILFNDPSYRPDQLKIYPCVVTPYSELYKLWENGEYIPYSDEELIELLAKIKAIVPTYVRIIRVIRDIPADQIVAGSKMSNMRQVLQKMVKCRCIRCRQATTAPLDWSELELVRLDYEASEGQEVFLSFESKDRETLFAFLRLRRVGEGLVKKWTDAKAVVREIHTYGPLVPLHQKDALAVQHFGLGKKLLSEAERIAKEEWNVNRIAVIAGIGAREYFLKQGYRLLNTYMVKDL